MLLAQGSGLVLFFVMLHVRYLSGAPVTELHAEELKARLRESERSLVVALKRFLGAQLGCSRFQLKLLGENSKEIDDDTPLTGPADFLVVRMDFQTSEVATNAAFISACKEGSVTEVDRLLHAPQNPDIRDEENNCTGTHWAARNGHLDVVRLLLEAGADKHAVMRYRATALHVAAQNGHLDVVRLLLAAGADKDAEMQAGRTALHLAAHQGHLHIVRLLLEAGADKGAQTQTEIRMWPNIFERVGFRMRRPCKIGSTALHIASQKGRLDIVRLLLEAGSDRDAQTQDGATALDIAAENGHLDVAEFLRQAGEVPQASYSGEGESN